MFKKHGIPVKIVNPIDLNVVVDARGDGHLSCDDNIVTIVTLSTIGFVTAAIAATKYLTVNSNNKYKNAESKSACKPQSVSGEQ